MAHPYSIWPFCQLSPGTWLPEDFTPSQRGPGPRSPRSFRSAGSPDEGTGSWSHRKPFESIDKKSVFRFTQLMAGLWSSRKEIVIESVKWELEYPEIKFENEIIIPFCIPSKIGQFIRLGNFSLSLVHVFCKTNRFNRPHCQCIFVKIVLHNCLNCLFAKLNNRRTHYRTLSEQTVRQIECLKPAGCEVVRMRCCPLALLFPRIAWYAACSHLGLSSLLRSILEFICYKIFSTNFFCDS